MKFFPYDSFRIYSDHNADNVSARLKSFVATPKALLKTRLTALENVSAYVGWVTENEFKIKPRLVYPNPYRPVIVGSIEEVGAGSVIHIKQRLSVERMLTTGALLFFASFILADAIPLDSLSKVASIAALMLLGGWLIFMVGFWVEARNTKSELVTILNARIAQCS